MAIMRCRLHGDHGFQALSPRSSNRSETWGTLLALASPLAKSNLAWKA